MTSSRHPPRTRSSQGKRSSSRWPWLAFLRYSACTDCICRRCRPKMISELAGPPCGVAASTTSGEQFGLGLADIMRVSQVLSPDGRWLAPRRDGQRWIRDLTGNTERAGPPGYELRQSSTDGRALLLGQPSGADEAYAAFTLPGGELRPLALRGTPNDRHSLMGVSSPPRSSTSVRTPDRAASSPSRSGCQRRQCPLGVAGHYP